jgi:hypothetical protein
MRPPRFRRAVTAWAAAVAALLLLATCARDGGGGAGGGGAGNPSPTASPIDYRRSGAPTQVGTGFLVEMSPDGSAAYVQEEDPRFPQPGCEGQPEPVMFRLPLAGGEREVLGAGKEPLNGDLVRGKGRRVAVVSGCEGFFERLLVGTETADGRLGGLKEVPLRRSGEDPAPSPNTFAWTADGKHLLAAVNELAAAGPGKPVVLRIDPSSGVVTRLFQVSGSEGVSQAGQLEDGTYVLAGGGQVTLRDDRGAVREAFPGNGFAISPDGRRIAVFREGLVLITPGGDDPLRLTPQAEKDREVTSAAFSPDGRAIAYVSSVNSVNTVEIVTPAEARVAEVAGPGPLGRPVFSGDGKALAFNEFGGEAAGFVARVLLVRFGG